MAVEKSCDQVGLVAVDVAGLAAPYEITEQCFRDFRIRIWGKGLPQHGGCDRHVEHMQPAIHAGQSFRQIPVSMAERSFVEAARNRNLAAKQIAQQLLIKTLDGCQNCQLKFKILGQERSASETLPVDLEFFTAVQVKRKVTDAASY